MAVPTPLLAVLLALLVIATLAVVFLVGRESGRREVAAPSPPLGSAAAGPPASLPAAPQQQPATATLPAELPPPAAASPGWPGMELSDPDQGRRREDVGGRGAPTGSSPLGGQGTPAAPAAPGTTSTPVARYFAEFEAAESGGKTWSDPQAFAGTLLQQMIGGDTSGVDRLAADQRRVLETIRQLDVPDACREHHSRAVAVMSASLALLDRLRQSAGGGNLEALMSLPAEAQTLEAQAREVEALGDRIKRAHGVAG